MKQLVRTVVAVIVLVAGFLLASPHTTLAAANNFYISNYDIQYELSRDSEGRSVLHTTEMITAVFPEDNQNHGLERALPTTYNNHPTSLAIVEVKNLTNNSTQHTTTDINGVKQVRIGDANTYVHGKQTYKIEYTQRDVTRFYKDTGRDEWYWDTNGVEWRVPINRLTVTVALKGDVDPAVVNKPFCYQGRVGDDTRCSLQKTPDGTYVAMVEGLSSQENVTVAFGFTSGTFTPYAKSGWELLRQAWVVIQLISIPLAFIALIVTIIMFVRKNNRLREVQSIVTEYIPPKDASVAVAAKVMGLAGSEFAAQLIDLAVRRHIAIIETRPKSTWRAAEYDIIITSDLADLRAEEKEIITDMFGHTPQKDERLALKSLQNNMSYMSRTRDNDTKLTALVESTYALRAKDAAATRKFYRWAIGLGIFAVLTLSIPLIGAALLIAVFGYTLRPLTDKGLALRRYLMGLNKYIKASEKERLAFLQGPETADKIGYTVDVENPGQMMKLYERVLPYAILFGYQKEWSNRLGEFYQQTGENPEWYSGGGVFNAVLFSSVMSNFSQATAYSSGSSSSSGGSSGGGASGGGGGGGGGGGW